MTRRPSKEALQEVFGTPRPNRSVVVDWKAKWREQRGKVKVSSYSSAVKWLIENNIDPLYYQFYFGEGSWDGPYIVFYNPEHEVFFKMHNFCG
jgi:hypothetical protein